MEVKALSLQELKQSLQNIIDEFYHLLSIKINEKDAEKILGQFKKVDTLVQQVQNLEDIELKEAISFQEALSDSKIHLKQLQAQVEYQNKKGGNLKLESDNLQQFYIIFYNCVCHIKQATLLINSQQLGEQQYSKLDQVKKQFFDLNRQKTMFRSMQLKKQNDDGQYILNLIQKEINFQISKTKDNLQNIESECNELEKWSKYKNQLYCQYLKSQNDSRRNQLKMDLHSKKQQAKLTHNFQFRKSHTDNNYESSTLFETTPIKIVQYSNFSEKYEQWTALLLLLVNIVIIFYITNFFKPLTSII